MKTISETLSHFGWRVLKDLEDPIKLSCLVRTGTSIWGPKGASVWDYVSSPIIPTIGVSLWTPVLGKSKELLNENN